MKPKHMITALLSVATAALLLGASQGTETDPLVTKSYIDNVVAPSILTSLESTLDQRETTLTDTFNAAIAQYKADTEALLADAGQGTTTEPENSSVFKVVVLTKGQTLRCSTGAELLLRSGTATVVATSSPGLIDSTWGTTLASGNELLTNHLYLITADNRGLSASTDVTVMVRGSYTIS